jgi:hypothetical protein
MLICGMSEQDITGSDRAHLEYTIVLYGVRQTVIPRTIMHHLEVPSHRVKPSRRKSGRCRKYGGIVGLDAQ